MLSSGEGQLLFLLASTIVARERSSLFMIDEPELSLNVAWQRQLVKSLLELTRDSSVQFVLATHSIELLTRYSEFVLDLESTSKH
jgi:ABC-type glutathione transport system ATPase component